MAKGVVVVFLSFPIICIWFYFIVRTHRNIAGCSACYQDEEEEVDDDDDNLNPQQQ